MVAVPGARLLASEVADPDRRRSLRNTHAAATVVAVLLVAVALAASGVTWGIWIGFVAGALAVVGAGMNLRYALSGGPPPARGPSYRESARITRLLLRGRPVPPQDAELAHNLARQNLRNLGLAVWTGPLVASGQLAAVPVRDGSDVFRLVLLVIALGMSITVLAISVRFRRGLLTHPGRP